MNAIERNAIISLIEGAMDKLALEDIPSAEVLLNRSLYWLQGYEGDDFDDDNDDFDNPQLSLRFDLDGT